MSENPAGRVLAAIDRERWLIEPDALDTIRAIAERAMQPQALGMTHASEDTRPAMVRSGNAAIVTIRGPMFRYANLMTEMSGASSTEHVSRLFGEAVASDAERIVLDIDSPGGMANGVSELAAQVAASPKPVTAYISGSGASAAYWVASQADAIVINDTAIAGSIGVRSTAPTKRADDDIVSRRAPKKLGSREGAQHIVDALEERFFAAVAAGRGVDVETVEKNFGQGDVFVGAEAVTAGLADEVGTLDQIIAGAAGMKRATSPQPTPEREDTMSQGTEKAGGISTAEQEQAVRAARAEGKSEAEAAARAQAKAESEQAVQSERARVTRILTAGATKAPAAVAALIEQGVSAEAACAVLEATPDAATHTGLDAAMAGRNPRVATLGEREEDETEAASAAYITGARSAIEEAR